METAYHTQSHLVKPKEAEEHVKAVTDVNKAYAKAAEAAKDNLYHLKQPDMSAPLAKGRLAIQIGGDLKPLDVLSSVFAQK